MKLLLCLNCGDIIAAHLSVPTSCLCGKSTVLQANPADTAYQGPGAILKIDPRDMEHLRNDPDWPCRITRLDKDHPFIYKSQGKDCGARWGKARSRARRGLANADGDRDIFTSVKMEWDHVPRKKRRSKHERHK